MLNLLFDRKKRGMPEAAPQLTLSEKNALKIPSPPTGGLPYSTYDQMLGDAMVQTAVTIKRQAVLASDWKVVPANDSAAAREKADFVMEVFDQMEGTPLTIVDQALDSIVKGWSIQEKVFEYRKQKVWMKATRPKDPRLFGLDVDSFGAIKGLILELPGETKRSLPLSKFIVHIHRKSYANVKGKSDLDAAYRHWQAKQELLQAWKLHLSRFAMPTILGRYRRGLPTEDQHAILRALQDVQNNLAIVCPEEIDVSTLGGIKEGNSGFELAVDFHNREIARAILGQTLTTDEGRRVGSLALGRIHLQVLMLQIVALRKEVADAVITEQVIKPLIDVNFGPGLYPRFEFVAAPLEAFRSGAVS